MNKLRPASIYGDVQLTLQEQRQERNHEHQENANDAAANPVKDGNEVVATGLSTPTCIVRVELAYQQRFIQGT